MIKIMFVCHGSSRNRNSDTSETAAKSSRLSRVFRQPTTGLLLTI